jgi:hypothetical protein
VNEPIRESQRYYDTLDPRTQLLWRLEARRNFQDALPFLDRTGEPFDEWTDRLETLHLMGRDVCLALDVMMIALLDPPPVLRPGLLRTAWAILLTTDPHVSLGQDDAERLEFLARRDTGHVIGPEAFEDAVLEACIPEEERLNDRLCTPGQNDLLVTHPAATSLSHLKYAVRHGLNLQGASPDLQAAILRLLDTDAALINTSTVLNAGHSHQRHDEQLASICVSTVLRLLFVPQLIPGHTDVNVSLAMSAVLWRLARDLWPGPAGWKADLNLLRTYLKALGRTHDMHRQMRALESYGPAFDSRHASAVVEEALKLHGLLIREAHTEIPDVEQGVLDLPDTPAGRLAQRIAFIAHCTAYPPTQWGPHMNALAARVQNVPTSQAVLPFSRRAQNPENMVVIVDLITAATRAAVLLATARTPGREVLAACAVGLAQLREATRLGAAIGTFTLEFETALRVLWRSLGCPPCTWLTANHGPADEEATAWEGQIEALINAARKEQETPDLRTTDLAVPSVPAPKSYAFVPWQKPPERQEQKNDEDRSVTPFTCDLTPTEQGVLKALAGKTLVILGGICKPHAKAALIRDLKLRDVDWIESAEYDHGQHAASRLRDPNIVAVVFALRWAAHAHGSIRDVAWSLGIPAVSLPGGYSPRQVLHQLSTQVSGSLVA